MKAALGPDRKEDSLCCIIRLLPFIDRNPERNPIKRPIAMIAGITTILAMAYLTVEGARAGAPGQVSSAVSQSVRASR